MCKGDRMKSYKQRTLDAQKDLIRRYKQNDPPDKCPFCKIYIGHNPRYPEELAKCRRGCFMAGRKSKPYEHCSRFYSFLNSTFMSTVGEQRRIDRLNFHKKVRKILLKRPAKYFTPSHWKYLDIPKEW